MYHENESKLTEKTKDQKRAIDSLKEELEAIDWYQQRVDATENKELKAILSHNRDEEKEHAAMLIEWLRKSDNKFEEELKEYLFKDKDLSTVSSDHK
jgi:hypothetical protein